MPPVDQLAAFVVTSVLILIIPGPSVLFVISRGIALGRQAAFATVVGNSLGAFSQMALVAVGLGAIVQRSIAAYNVIKFAGAAYLVFLGWQAFRHRHATAQASLSTAEPKSVVRIVKEGYIVGISNPKLVVFASAALPQYVDRKSGGVPLQMLVLAGLFMILSVGTDGLYAFASGTARTWFDGSPRRLANITGAGGLAIVGLGINLAVSQRHK